MARPWIGEPARVLAAPPSAPPMIAPGIQPCLWAARPMSAPRMPPSTIPAIAGVGSPTWASTIFLIASRSVALPES